MRSWLTPGLAAVALLWGVGCSDVVYHPGEEPAFGIDTATLDFGEVAIGEQSGPLAFTVSSVGQAELAFHVGAINSLSTAFEFAGDNGPGEYTLQVDGELEFEVLFAPEQLGDHSGSVDAEPTNVVDGGQGRTVVLSGSGV